MEVVIHVEVSPTYPPNVDISCSDNKDEILSDLKSRISSEINKTTTSLDEEMLKKDEEQEMSNQNNNLSQLVNQDFNSSHNSHQLTESPEIFKCCHKGQ